MKQIINQKYRTVMCDPPWDINQKGKRGAARHYPLMTLDQIKAMPVADLCEENAHLYLWVPNGLLPEGLEVVKEWGFTYRSPLYWIKPRLLLGNFIRNASETCLFATRGRAPVKFHAQPNWLFARRRQPGWDAWGNEIDSDIVIPGYPVPRYSDKVAGGDAPETEGV